VIDSFNTDIEKNTLFDVKGVLVPENSNLPYGQFQVLPYAFRGIFTLLQQEGLMVPFLHGMHLVVFDT